METIDSMVLSAEPSEDSLATIIRRLRTHRRSRPVRYDTLLQVQTEMRKQRKRLLGSAVPFSAFLYPDGETMHTGVVDLTEYLARRTHSLWKKPEGEHFHFCHQFYELAFACPSWVTLDDIVLMAATLVRDNKMVFIYLMEDLLPATYHELMRSFVTDFPSNFYAASFEDAVFEAILILLGVLKDAQEEEV